MERFLPLVFRDDRKLLLHSLPVRTIHSEDAVVIQNLRLFKSHRLGIVLRYDCILDGIFELRGKKYGIVSETAYICPVPEKGEYLGEVNGVKCYEFKGKADAILVDLGKYVSPSDGSIYESLYVAELIG